MLAGQRLFRKAPLSLSLGLKRMFARKAGVESPADLRKFVAAAGTNLIIVDTRNPDFTVEPGDEKSVAVAAIAGQGSQEGYRPRALNLIYDRSTKSMDLSLIPEEWIKEGGGKASVPIITHCGGGGRGQKAKMYLQENGFGNVVNGGGPKDTECWAEFGDK